jgi:HAD superfamily hydrolase (TIGR01509 family)
MPIKLVIFDLDGVLIDSREIHFITLNLALEEQGKHFVISKEEHLAKYDGHPTKYKLDLLTKEKHLPQKLHNKIWERKQELTQQVILDSFTDDNRIIQILQTLKQKGYTLYCASNSIWATVKNSLLTKGFLPYIDYFVSNEEVRHPKPSPEIYFKCFERANIIPKEALICEDSPVGRQSAYASGAYVCPIENVADLSFEKINEYIERCELMDKYEQKQTNLDYKHMNIVIPMAGAGSRFKEKGYSFIKPLIDVKGKPMIQVVVDNIGTLGRYIFIVQKDHYEQYNLNYLLNAIAPNCEIIITEGKTQGAACSILLAKDLINNEHPLMIANSDQYLEWDSRAFVYKAISDDVDGAISTFTNTHPKFSYARLDENGYVTEVAEKKPISDVATTGIYYWKHGADYVKYAEQMIEKDIRVNNEYYTAPVYNQAIGDGKKIKTVHCNKFYSLGDPESLEYYLSLSR